MEYRIMPYKKGSRQPFLRATPPHNDHERPPGACPTCGRAYDAAPILAPFDSDLSAALDSLTSAAEAISHAKAVLEEVAL
jgi:hypothetical protein